MTELARRNNINPYYQEKDYLINVFLRSLYQFEDEVVFKGGTCLKLVYNHPRFSEDLDFNTTKKPAGIKKAVRKTLGYFTDLGVESEVVKEESFKETYTIKLRFQGPLYAGRPDSTNTIRVDAGLRDRTLIKPAWRQVTSPYPDVPNYMVYAMQLMEIHAEKIRALLTRSKGRDLYDLWMLTPQVKPDMKLINQKTKLLSQEITLPTRKQYQSDIQNLLPNPPPYTQIKKQVQQTLEKLQQKHTKK